MYSLAIYYWYQMFYSNNVVNYHFIFGIIFQPRIISISIYLSKTEDPFEILYLLPSYRKNKSSNDNFINEKNDM